MDKDMFALALVVMTIGVTLMELLIGNSQRQSDQNSFKAEHRTRHSGSF
jgi:hypothetical protein